MSSSPLRPMRPRCTVRKCGEYNPLRCAREQGHEGEHGYVVDGQYPLSPETHRQQGFFQSQIDNTHEDEWNAEKD